MNFLHFFSYDLPFIIAFINITNPLSIIIYPIFLLILNKLSYPLNELYQFNENSFGKMYVIFYLFNIIYIGITSYISIGDFTQNKIIPIENILLKNYIIPIFILYTINLLAVIKQNINLNDLNNLGNLNETSLITFALSILLILIMNYYFFIKWIIEKQSFILSSITILNLMTVTFYVLLVVIYYYFYKLLYKFIN